MSEPDEVARRYARRGDAGRYDPARSDVRMLLAERRAALEEMLGPCDRASMRVLEVGCGAGGNLLELVGLGFSPAKLAGIELLPARFEHARRVLPPEVRLVCGDALDHPPPDASLDLVYVSTVFSSLLDDTYQQRLADAMWRWLTPGGAVLWYDFTVDNPRNPDVRGMPPARVRALFPQAAVRARRVTLAPPIARAVCRLHPCRCRERAVKPPGRSGDDPSTFG